MNVPRPALLALPGVEHRDVWVRGVRLHVAEAGEGPPLILLHGWPQHWWCWRHLIPRLAERFRVLAPDLRGWGWSDAPAGDYAKSAFADDVLALLDAEELERARVIGHDWGGYAAFLLALSHPDRVQQLLALDIPPLWRGKAHAGQLAIPLFLSYQLVLATPGLGTRTLTAGNRFVRTVIRAGSGRGANWSDVELDVYADVLRDPARAAASSACYRTFLLRELPTSLRGAHRPFELAVPTLIVMGAESPVERVAAPQPSHNLRVERIPGAGHFLPEEAPEPVLELALSFFAG